MDLIDKIQDIIHFLEDAISYNDMDSVEDAKRQLSFLLEELESNYTGLEDLDDMTDEEY
jgi:hypothetical protein